jgi:hypothetical protein
MFYSPNGSNRNKDRDKYINKGRKTQQIGGTWQAEDPYLSFVV